MQPLLHRNIENVLGNLDSGKIKMKIIKMNTDSINDGWFVHTTVPAYDDQVLLHVH